MTKATTEAALMAAQSFIADGGLAETEPGASVYQQITEAISAPLGHDELSGYDLAQPGSDGVGGARAIVRRWANWIIDASADMEVEDHDAGKRLIRQERDTILAALASTPAIREGGGS